MIKWILISLGLICISITFLWFKNDAAKTFINNVGPLFSLVSSILALTIFLQFYNDFKKSQKENDEKITLEKAKLNSKMVSLGTEMMNNILICNLFEGDKERHLLGIEAPNITFEYFVMEDMLKNGEIIHHKLRAELTSIIFQMKALNRIIETQAQIMSFKRFVETDRLNDIKADTINSMKILHLKISGLRTQIVNCDPFFKELWNNPDKFKSEKYLKENLHIEGVIR